MITKNPMQLKAIVKKKAIENNITAQLVMQNYMLERLLDRISRSKYKYNFIIKGGFLISAIVGLDTRTTMDLDTTVKGFTLVSLMLETKVSSTMPITSSIIAALKITVPTLPFSRPSSRSTSTVMPTEVAVIMVPIKTPSINPLEPMGEKP